MYMKTQLREATAVVASPLVLVMGLAFTQAQSGYAQTQAPSDTQTNQASDVGVPGSMSANASANRPAVTPDATAPQTSGQTDVQQNAVPCESSKANTNNQQPGSMAAYQGTPQAGMNQDKSGATHYVVDPNHVEIDQGRADSGR
jgi:hypothetical protein